MKAQSPDDPEPSSTMSVRLRGDVRTKLATLAQRTRRTRSVLANEAIAAYVERELAIIDSIERGLADMDAGRVMPHEDAMRRLRATIADAQQGR